MRRSPVSLVVSVAASAALALTTMSPASAAGHGQKVDQRYYATTTFTLMGPVRHAPGNAHSGSIATAADSDFATGGELIDWACPRGVVPPVSTYSATACTVLRDRVYQGEGGEGNTLAPDYDTSRMGRLHVFGMVGDLDGRVVPVDYRLRPAGPVTRSVSGDSSSVTVTKTRSFRISGHLDDFSFNDSRLHSTSSITALIDYQRAG